MNGNNRWTTHSTAKIKIQRFSIHFIYIQLNRQSCSSRILFWMNHRRRWVYVNGSRQKQSSELSINLLQIHSLHSLSSMSMSNSIHIYILPPFFPLFSLLLSSSPRFIFRRSTLLWFLSLLLYNVLVRFSHFTEKYTQLWVEWVGEKWLNVVQKRNPTKISDFHLLFLLLTKFHSLSSHLSRVFCCCVIRHARESKS